MCDACTCRAPPSPSPSLSDFLDFFCPSVNKRDVSSVSLHVSCCLPPHSVFFLIFLCRSVNEWDVSSVYVPCSFTLPHDVIFLLFFLC